MSIARQASVLKAFPIVRTGIAISSLLFAICCGGDDLTLNPAPVTVPEADDDRFDELVFRYPPAPFRPYVRWWWPGGAVDPVEIDRELATLHERGFGGVEVQPFTFDLDGGQPEVKTYGTSAFYERVRATMASAARHDMAVDLNLGSSWPSGGPFAADAQAMQLLASAMDVEGPTDYEGPIPPVEPPAYASAPGSAVGAFDEQAELVAVVAARVVASEEPVELTDLEDLGANVDGGVLRWAVPSGAWKVFALYENPVRQHVFSPAYPGDGESVVVDHFDRRGADSLIANVTAPMRDALGGARPGAFFVDSFELWSELPWTGSMLGRFRADKGYDPVPYLPLFFRKSDESEPARTFGPPGPRYVSSGAEQRAREDYEDVREAAFVEEFLEPLRAWCNESQIALRVQAHGAFADYLDAYAAVDIPEAEGLSNGGSYDFLKLAPSAAHVAGKRTVSSESFVAVVTDSQQLDLDDFRLLSGRAFSAGINRIIYHGYAYQYESPAGEWWYPFDRGPTYSTRLDPDHPVWPKLPAFNAELARLSYTLSRGKHVADIAWLHPEAEEREFATVNFNGFPPEDGETKTSRAIKHAGFVYDRVSRAMLASSSANSGRLQVGEASYGALLLTDWEIATPEMISAVESAVSAGVPVFVIGGLPVRARGLVDAAARDELVASAVARLATSVHALGSPSELPAALHAAAVAPSLSAPEGEPFLFSPEHRATAGSEILYLFNESNDDREQTLGVNLDVGRVRMLEPTTGVTTLDASIERGGAVHVRLGAKRSVVLVFDR